MKTVHIPVLLEEVVAALAEPITNDPDPLLLDCTLGGGGHTSALLKQFPRLRVVALDRDEQAIAKAKVTLGEGVERCELHHLSFSEIERSPEILAKTYSAILCDLGISSDQLNDPDRGFSFQGSGPLDMRMDSSQDLTAAEVLNNYSEGALQRVFERGGLGRFSRALARQIVVSRPLNSTADFAALCGRVIKNFEKGAKNPATVPFQAVRIEVNGEFHAIEALLAVVLKLLRPGGRFAAISFHSLEDELITRAMRSWSQKVIQRRFIGEIPAEGALLTSSATVPSEVEVNSNPRSRSARLRVFERRKV